MSSRNKEDREFLHDIATPLTLLTLVLRRLQKHHAGDQFISKETEEQLVQKALDSLDKAFILHAEHKDRLFARELEDAKDLESFTYASDEELTNKILATAKKLA